MRIGPWSDTVTFFLQQGCQKAQRLWLLAKKAAQWVFATICDIASAWINTQFHLCYHPLAIARAVYTCLNSHLRNHTDTYAACTFYSSVTVAMIFTMGCILMYGPILLRTCPIWLFYIFSSEKALMLGIMSINSTYKSKCKISVKVQLHATAKSHRSWNPFQKI